MITLKAKTGRPSLNVKRALNGIYYLLKKGRAEAKPDKENTKKE